MTALARYHTADGPRLGRIIDDEVLDLAGPGGAPARSLSDVIGIELRPLGTDAVRLADVVLLAPHPRPPRNIFCVGKNYREHAVEFAASGFDQSAGAEDGADQPLVVFTKPATSIVGPDEPVEFDPELTCAVDYEVELAVVIGTGGRAISPERALDHVFGYTVVNDVTARDLQQAHRQWFIGKSLDTFCPMGPVVVTRDALDISDARVRSYVNGELRQDASTADLIYDVPTIIARLSAGLTLEPGDVIATGTPAGVGIGFDPPRFLADGDSVTVEIDGIGTLTNQIRHRPPARR